MKIYIDESGDLGKGSNYFIIAAIVEENPKTFDKIIKKTYKQNRNKLDKINEIKGTKTPPKVKKYILNRLNKEKSQVYGIIFNKKNRFNFNQCTNNELYDLLACELAKLIEITKHTIIYIDKSKNKKEEINKFNYSFLKNLGNNKEFKIEIKHKNSLNYKGLQIADLISWSIYQSIENNNSEYIELINNKIIKEVFKN